MVSAEDVGVAAGHKAVPHLRTMNGRIADRRSAAKVNDRPDDAPVAMTKPRIVPRVRTS